MFYLLGMKDLLGQAIWDCYKTGQDVMAYSETSISEMDEMPIRYFFRTYAEMSSLEQKAMNLSAGKVLDVGCGAGAHALYLQDEEKLEVTAIDTSPKAIATCVARGVKKALCVDLLMLENEQFDTILLLMNGTGIFQSLDKISDYLAKLSNLLAPGGKILIDGSDIIYMFDQEEDGSYLIPANGKYYGEVDYLIYYQGDMDEPISWLYLDYNTLQNAAEANGFAAKLLQDNDDYSYLAELRKAE